MNAPFQTDLEFLGSAMELLRLEGQVRIARRQAQHLSLRDPVLSMSEAPVDLEALEAERDRQREEHEARLGDFEPALLRLQAQFGLDAFERDLLLLCLAPALDAGFSALIGRAKGSAYPSPLDIDAALTLLTDGFEERISRRQAFGRSGRLLTNSLLLVGHGLGSGDAFLGMELRLPPRLVGLLVGLPGEDESLQGFARLISPAESLEQVVLPAETKAQLEALVATHARYLETLADWGIGQRLSYGKGLTILFSGPPGTGKTLTARALANAQNLPLLRVDATQLAAQPARFEQNLDHLFREARLQRAILFFDECEGLFGAHQRLGGVIPSLLQALEFFEGITILATNVPQVLDHALERRILHRVTFELPAPSLRAQIWQAHIPDSVTRAPDVDLAYLARRFEFVGGLIKNAVLLATARASARSVADGEAPVLTQADLMAGAWAQLRHRLGDFADQDTTQLRLSDLVLPEDVRGQIEEIIEAVAAQSTVFRDWGFGKKFNKGRGLSALFDGEPGTGKTLSAEIIAAELGLRLMRVNVANVVSKYIGETEKNLTRIFGEARGSQSVLLFDEADSLFSKRVEVKQANDRFSNMEINVLLQLIERYDGLVLLTTNLKTSLDTAFERRLSYKVNFPFPDAELRSTIWRQLIPESAPVSEDLDFDILGDAYELSGGSIKNAVLRAAYRAAAQGQPLSMEGFEEAARRECQAMGKVFRTVSRWDSW